MKTLFISLVILILHSSNEVLSDFQSDVYASVCASQSGSISTKNIIDCGLSISDTTNFSIETFSIYWTVKGDTVEMPVHRKIPEYYNELISKIEPSSKFKFKDIAIRNKVNGEIMFVPSVEFIINE